MRSSRKTFLLQIEKLFRRNFSILIPFSNRRLNEFFETIFTLFPTLEFFNIVTINWIVDSYFNMIVTIITLNEL